VARALAADAAGDWPAVPHWRERSQAALTDAA